jgi:hypothetical protein
MAASPDLGLGLLFFTAEKSRPELFLNSKADSVVELALGANLRLMNGSNRSSIWVNH